MPHRSGTTMECILLAAVHDGGKRLNAWQVEHLIGVDDLAVGAGQRHAPVGVFAGSARLVL